MPQTWTDPLVQPKRWKRDLRFGTWNLRGLYRPGSLTTVTRGLAKYKLGLMGVQGIRWDKMGTVRAGDYIFFYGQGNENHQLGAGHFVHHEILSAVKRVDSVSDRMSYIVLRRSWLNSYGYDEISTKVLKISATYICSPLTYICKKSVLSGKFPDRMKFSTVKPILCSWYRASLKSCK